MFEGHINRASFAEARENEVLRQFRWTDLVARIAATRELRDEVARQGEGDFHAFAQARKLETDGKPAINHAGLTDRKAGVVSVDQAASDAGQGDRENND